MKRFLVFAIVLALIGVMPVYAENSENAEATNMQILIDKVKADKKLLVASNMDLTDRESKEFWPLYEGYQNTLKGLNSRLKKIIEEYAGAYNKGFISDDLAKKLIDGLLENQGEELKMMREYSQKFAKILPATKVARYLQIENKIRAAMKYDLAANIPLIY